MTSGTTAEPKAIKKTLANLEAEAEVLETVWGGVAGPVFATISHQHIYGLLFRVIWPIVAKRPSAAYQADYWEQLQGCLGPGSILVSSPAHLSRLPPALSADMYRPQTLFSSGAPLSFADAQICRSVFGTCPVEVLGSTETGGIAWRTQQWRDQPWTPLPGVRISSDSQGRLAVSSPFTGRDQPVPTGDRINMEDGNTFTLVGRCDTIVKVEGKRVSLTRIEHILKLHDDVHDAAVIVWPERGGVLSAAIVLRAAGASRLARDGAFKFSRLLRKQLANQLEPTERPKRWRFVDALPVNSQGKRTSADVSRLFETTGPVTRSDAAVDDQASVRLVEDLSAEIDIQLDPQMVWFRGHFPGQPLLPGVSEVHLAFTWARRLWTWQPANAHLHRLKFRRILFPQDKVRLVLKRDIVRDRLYFRFCVDDVVAGEGTIGGEG